MRCQCGCYGPSFERCSSYHYDLKNDAYVEYPDYEAKLAWNANQIEFRQRELQIALPRLHWVVSRQYTPRSRFPTTRWLDTGKMTIRVSRVRGLDIHLLRRLKFVVPQFVTDRFEADMNGRITDIPPFRFRLDEGDYATHLVSLTRVEKNLANLGGSDFHFDIHRTEEKLDKLPKSRKKFVDEDWLAQQTPMSPVTLKVFEKLGGTPERDEEDSE